MAMLALVIFLQIQGCTWGYINLIKNPGFENTTSSVWRANGAEISFDSDISFQGNFSLRVFNRTLSWQGPTQDIPLKPATHYNFDARVKQLNSPGNLSQVFNLDIIYVFPHGSSSFALAKHPVPSTQTDWIRLRTRILTPAENFSTSTLRLSGPAPDVEFLVDDVFSREVDFDWMERVNAKTDAIRKNKIHFEFILPKTADPAEYSVKIDLRRHKFGFGALLDPESLASPQHEQLVFDNFNWASVSLQGAANYSSSEKQSVTRLLDKLKSHNIKIRGKGLLDDGTCDNDYFQDLSESELNKTLVDVINSIGPDVINKFSQMNLLNNVLRHQLNYDTTELRNTQLVYQTFNTTFEDVELYLDEDNVINEGYLTNSFGDLTTRVGESLLDGIGTTLELIEEPDPRLLQARLYMFNFQLPIWITAIKFNNQTDDLQKADWLEKALRVLFSYQRVFGVTFNVFSDGQQPGLFGGEKLQPTLAGQRLLNLINKDLSTHEQLDLVNGTTLTVNGYHGEYDVTVYRKSKPIMQTSFTHGHSDLVYVLHIDSDKGELIHSST